MRTPVFEIDGWGLEDAEELSRQHPLTFHIPDRAVREILQPGDFAKVVVRIAVDSDEEGAVERLWVVVRERLSDGYIGILDNEPTLIEENEFFWRGTELPFGPQHIIAVEHASPESLALIARPAPILWSRD